MSHDDFAQLWYEIEGRFDLKYLLQESFANAWFPISSDTLLPCAEFLILSKSIFDYQRYLLRTKQAHEALSKEELIHAINCVVKLNNRLCPPDTRKNKPSIFHSLARQAFVSGIRGFIILAELTDNDPVADAQSLSNLLDSWTPTELVDEEVLERFGRASAEEFRAKMYAEDHSHLFVSDVQCTRSYSHESYPNNVQALLSQQKRFEELAASIRWCITHNCQHRYRAFWEWMDLELMSTISSYQYVDCEVQRRNTNDCHHLKHEEKSMITDGLHFFSKFSMKVQENLVRNSEDVLMDQYRTWLRSLQPLSQCPDSHLGNCFPITQVDINQLSGIQQHLRNLTNNLRLRASAASKSCITVSSIERRTRQDIVEWLRPPSPSSDWNMDPVSEFKLYALSCPSAHVVWDSQLPNLQHFAEGSAIADLRKIELGASEFELNIPCPVCRKPCHWAREIVPLSLLLRRMRFSEPVVRPATPPPLPLQPPPPPPLTPQRRSPAEMKPGRLAPPTTPGSPSLRNSNLTPPHEVTPSSPVRAGSDKRSQTSSGLSRFTYPFSRRSTPGSISSPKVVIKTQLSTNAHFMVAYSGQKASCYSFASEFWSTEPSYGVNIVRVAVGPKNYAFADETSVGPGAKQWRLHIHKNISGAEIALSTAVQNLDYPVRSLAFSKDDSQFAFATERYVVVVDTARFEGWKKIFLEGPLRVGSGTDTFNTQMMTFTQDGAYLCLSSRVQPSGQTSTVIFEVGAGKIPQAIKVINSIIDGNLNNDHGLTAIASFHSGFSLHYLVCSSTNASGRPTIGSLYFDSRQEHPAHHTRRKSTPVEHQELQGGRKILDHKLQNTVAMRVGSSGYIVIASDEGYVFRFHVGQTKSPMKILLSPGTIHRPGQRGYYDSVQMADMGDGKVRFAWFEEGAVKILELHIITMELSKPYSITLTPFIQD